jgi:hypothetical protein
LFFIFYKPKVEENNSNKNQNKKYIIFENYLVLEYENNKFVEETFDNKNIIEDKFFIYDNGNYLGNYYYRNFNSEISIYDDDSKPVNFSGTIIANNYDSNMKILNMETLTIDNNDIKLANTVLNDNNVKLNYDEKSSSIVKYNIDLDNNNKIGQLYVLSNMYSENRVDIGYSFLYYVIDNKINIIEKDIVKNGYGYMYNISSILDVNSDNKYDILLQKFKFGNGNFCYEIYTKNNEEFKKLKDC